MCCIVLKCYYLCDVIGINRISTSQKSIAMNKLFSEKNLTTNSYKKEYGSEIKITKP